MGKSTYPATNNQEAVDLNILNANAFHMVLNGDVTTDVPTYEGNGTIPSVAKALHTMAAYKAPIPWEEGVSEADILQPRTFADNIFVPIRVPAVMDSIPSDLYWKLYFPTVRESLNDTGENYFREVLEETKSTFTVPFDIKTYLVGGVERPQVTVFVHKGNDVVEKIDVAELTYVDKNTFTLLNPATAGNIVEIYSTTIADFTIVGAMRDDVYLAKDAVHADRLVAEQASTDAQAARDVAIAQRDVVIAEGDTQVARVASEGTQQVTLATEQAVRAEAAANVAEQASSKAYAHQSIVRAPIDPRPTGWSAFDCDFGAKSMSAERRGALVQIAAGLQVAYADEGRVQLSEVLDSAHAVNLSSAVTGMHYIYADISEDGKFTGFGHTPNKPMVGTERSGSGDLYNPATVTMYDRNDNPIRRVYLGWVGKSGNLISKVSCYAFGDSVTLPVASGLISLNTQYTLNYPFPGGPKDMIVREFAEIKFDNEWYSAKASSFEGQSGVGVNLQKDVIAVVSRADKLLHGLRGATGSAYSGVNVVEAPCRIHVKRGY